MKKSLIRNISGIVLLVLIFGCLCFFYSLCFRPQKEISIEENRTLQKVPDFSFTEFAKGNYQKEMEDSIGDQLLYSIEIKYGVKQVYNFFTDKFSKIPINDNKIPDIKFDDEGFVNNIDQIPLQDNPTELNSEIPTEIEQPDKNSYTYKEVVAGKLYKLDDSGYIVEKAHAPDEYCYELYDPEMLAAVTKPKYLFFIECSESADFNDLKKFNAFDYIKSQMQMDGYSMLSYNSFDEYKTLFYQTDHHWNHNGSWIGYKKIMEMLEGKSVDVIQPTGTHVYNTIYNGSLARDNLLRCATEKFTVYEFNLPPYKTYVNGEEKEYGYRSYYVSDEDFPHKTYANHYGMYYGDDWAKVVYDFNQPEKENLLILGTSFTNAVNELIASHYNKTHVLDFRYYRKQYGERINAEKYMEENDISKMVIIGNISSLGFRKNRDN